MRYLLATLAALSVGLSACSNELAETNANAASAEVGRNYEGSVVVLSASATTASTAARVPYRAVGTATGLEVTFTVAGSAKPISFERVPDPPSGARTKIEYVHVGVAPEFAVDNASITGETLSFSKLQSFGTDVYSLPSSAADGAKVWIGTATRSATGQAAKSIRYRFFWSTALASGQLTLVEATSGGDLPETLELVGKDAAVSDRARPDHFTAKFDGTKLADGVYRSGTTSWSIRFDSSDEVPVK